MTFRRCAEVCTLVHLPTPPFLLLFVASPSEPRPACKCARMCPNVPWRAIQMQIDQNEAKPFLHPAAQQFPPLRASVPRIYYYQSNPPNPCFFREKIKTIEPTPPAPKPRKAILHLPFSISPWRLGALPFIPSPLPPSPRLQPWSNQTQNQTHPNPTGAPKAHPARHSAPSKSRPITKSNPSAFGPHLATLSACHLVIPPLHSQPLWPKHELSSNAERRCGTSRRSPRPCR
jgi:hypothetical protein